MGRLFKLKYLPIPFKIVVAAITSSIFLGRLGHLSGLILGSLISSGCLGHVKTIYFACVSCQLFEHHVLPFSNSDSISSAPFDLIYYDIWGPTPNDTMGGSRYFVIFVHDYSRFTWIYLL